MKATDAGPDGERDPWVNSSTSRPMPAPVNAEPDRAAEERTQQARAEEERDQQRQPEIASARFLPCQCAGAAASDSPWISRII